MQENVCECTFCFLILAAHLNFSRGVNLVYRRISGEVTNVLFCDILNYKNLANAV